MASKTENINSAYDNYGDNEWVRDKNINQRAQTLRREVACLDDVIEQVHLLMSLERIEIYFLLERDRDKLRCSGVPL